MSVFAELPSIFFAEIKAERRSEFAFLTDSSDVTVGIMSRPLRLLIRSPLMILHWVVSNNVLACSNTVSKNISFIVFATSIMKFSVREINDNLRASRAQSQTQFELCRGAAVNADVSPNLLLLDRSSRGARVRLAA